MSELADPTLLSARTWLSRAETRARHRDFDRAFEFAQAGLEEIGDRYRGSGVRDDTEPKRWAAEKRVLEGKTEDAVELLVGVLSSRIRLYLLRLCA